MDIILNENERIDDLEIKDYHIIQNKKMFCFGVDAVLLANFAKVRRNDNVLDLCTGNGVIAMLLEAKTEGRHFTGIDIIEANIDMANRSIQMNGQTEKVDFICKDINAIKNEELRIKNYKQNNFPTANVEPPLICHPEESKDLLNTSITEGVSLTPGTFDVITCNPPYMENNKALKNQLTDKIIARHEVLCTLEDIISAASKLLTHDGRIYMIHKPHRLADIIYIMKKYKIEPKTIRNVYPNIDKAPTMVLIEGIHHAKSNLIIEPPLMVYNKEGNYTDEILRMYGKDTK